MSVTIFAQRVSIIISVSNRSTPLCMYERTSIRTSAIRALYVCTVRPCTCSYKSPVRCNLACASVLSKSLFMAARATHSVMTVFSVPVQEPVYAYASVPLQYCATLQYCLSHPASHSAYLNRLHSPRSFASTVSTVYKERT